MTHIKDTIQAISRTLESIDTKLDTVSDKADILELLEALEVIENYYEKNFCTSCDSDSNLPSGTTYKYGISLEFYIEADWWHDVSLALRKLKQKNTHNSSAETDDSA